jgi:hypothetical protein
VSIEEELRLSMMRNGQRPYRLDDCIAVADELSFTPPLRWLDALVRGKSGVYSSSTPPDIALAALPLAIDELDVALARLAQARLALVWAQAAATPPEDES